MSGSGEGRVSASKRGLRQVMADRRAGQGNRPELSARAIERLGEFGVENPELCVLWYLNIRSELETESTVRRLVDLGRRVVVPYCVGTELRLWSLTTFDELAPAGWEILEPRQELRTRQEQHVDPDELDLVIVPGLAFTAQGDRLGYGAGYYDRLLASTSAQRVGLCFEAQVVSQLPTDRHDVRMHAVVTETRTLKAN